MAAALNPEDAKLLRWRRQYVKRAMRRKIGVLRTIGRSNRVLPRKLEVTRDGKWMIAITLLLGIGAVNTGNNLLYLVLSLLISVITISGILSEWTLRGLKLKRVYPRELVAGESALLRVEVDNPKRSGAFNIEVAEVADEDALMLRPGYILHLRGGEKGQCFQVVQPRFRGPMQTSGLRMSTRYPFGFARKSRIFDDPADLLVLPPVADVDLKARGLGDRGEVQRSRRLGHGGEFRGLREARQGDALRDIHWKVSARRDRLIAREWEAEATRVVMLHFAHVAPDDLHDARLDPHLDPHVIDGACATVAGIARSLLAADMSVGLRTLQGVVPAAADHDGSAGHLRRIRRHLAELTCADRRPPAGWPANDETWLRQCREADAIQATVEARGALRWSGALASTSGEAWLVRWTARDDLTFEGAPPAVEFQLDSRGGIEKTITHDNRSRGAA